MFCEWLVDEVDVVDSIGDVVAEIHVVFVIERLEKRRWIEIVCVVVAVSNVAENMLKTIEIIVVVRRKSGVFVVETVAQFIWISKKVILINSPIKHPIYRP